MYKYLFNLFNISLHIYMIFIIYTYMCVCVSLYIKARYFKAENMDSFVLNVWYSFATHLFLFISSKCKTRLGKLQWSDVQLSIVSSIMQWFSRGFRGGSLDGASVMQLGAWVSNTCMPDHWSYSSLGVLQSLLKRQQ